MRVLALSADTLGVDMQKNPLFFEGKKAAFAKNMAFDQNTIRTRPGISYESSGISGRFNGAEHVSPSMGMLAQSQSQRPSCMALAVSGSVFICLLGQDGVEETIKLGYIGSDSNTAICQAENYVIFLNEMAPTYWWDTTGETLTKSKGIQPPGDENTHDAFEATNQIPEKSSLGVYLNGRTHISRMLEIDGKFTAGNSEIWVSDIIGKRGPYYNDDVLAMEEALLDSANGPLVGPSKFGLTVALSILPENKENGEGPLIDFRESGVIAHDTTGPRESTANAKGEIDRPGWDNRRISSVMLQTVSATGRYAVAQLPNDLIFRSMDGVHFMRSTLGEGSFKDEHINHYSHDIQPLIDIDEENDLSGAAVGHWLKGSRFLATVGMDRDDAVSSSSFGRGLVSMNQSSLFSEEGTPKACWEGLWMPDSGIKGIHRFSHLGKSRKSREYGIVCSSTSGEIHFGKFKKTEFVDKRGGKEIPIKWKVVTGAFLMSGPRCIDKITSGWIDFVGNQTTKNIKVSIRTDQKSSWVLWSEINPNLKEESLVSKSIGDPPRDCREATWFQFMIEGEGFIDIRFFEVEAIKDIEKKDGRNAVIPTSPKPEEYFK